ncbi:MAG TPA: hypothetical protein VN048_04670 [Verrucomicrobiae bacterium]|nr:hypothetical protein [Verrucomicrobiae bacterium]
MNSKVKFNEEIGQSLNRLVADREGSGKSAAIGTQTGEPADGMGSFRVLNGHPLGLVPNGGKLGRFKRILPDYFGNGVDGEGEARRNNTQQPKHPRYCFRIHLKYKSANSKTSEETHQHNSSSGPVDIP